MDFTVCVCALSVLLFFRWWCRSNGAKRIENIVESADGGDTTRDIDLEPKHKVFLSHSGAQKSFVEQLCVDLERFDRYPFFDKLRSSLPIGENFPKLIFKAIEHCEVGVVVLSEEFFMRSRWPMLELVAMKKNPKLKIIPVYLGISLERVRDPKHQKRWLSIWHGWADKDKRIDIEEWCGALKALGPINSLDYDGGSEVSFREKIVQAVCALVLSEKRWDDSHVRGRGRLAKVILEKINEAQVSKKYGIRLVGLHGVAGIGKTTICQMFCNEYAGKMRGRVFHMELGSASNLELLQGALKALTDKSHDVLSGLNESQCQDLLKREMGKQAIFLAIDNMSDNTKSIEQVKMFLSAGLDNGSIVIVTARSLEVLKLCHLDIAESNWLEMPELLEDEAKSLFLEHAICDDESGREVDDEIIDSCLKRCYFQKGDGRSYHYHPLALKVLGIQLGCNKYDRNKWAGVLKEVDTFNRGREEEHPVFSILRESFDSLLLMDRILFMDVALFLPEAVFPDLNISLFEWLSMVHGTNVHDILERLEGLKRKSLLQDLGDGCFSRIGMHDLWREFAVIESKVGEFECRRWVYEVGVRSAFDEGSPPRGFWQKIKRMRFLGDGLLSAKGINFDHFSNLIVLSLVSDIDLPGGLVLDLTKLRYLRSLELVLRRDGKAKVDVVGLDSAMNLQFLHLRQAELSATVIDSIGRLTNLRVLSVRDFEGARLPDLCKLIFLEEVVLSRVMTASGFSARLFNWNLDRDNALEPKHKVFLSHSGAQKDLVEQLCVDLERFDRYPFFDERRCSLSIGENFAKLIFKAIEQCEAGVVVLSEEFFQESKWPMLELVAMRKNPKLVIIPVYFGIFLERVRDPKHQKRWRSIWHGWADKDKRIDIEEWCGALKALGSLNSLVYDGVSEVSFREKIVQAVCALVLPEKRWNDSHVQGRCRLAKVICERINEAQVSKQYGIRLVGLYGVGGIGKTTICQTLCNEYYRKMKGRVFHMELGSASNLELLQGALKALSDKSHDVLRGLNESQCEELLKQELGKRAIFLAIDNVSDNLESIDQAMMFLSAGFANGSIVIVTARSLEVLKLCHLDIAESNWLEMPELHLCEARSLFLDHAIGGCESRTPVDDEIIYRCVERCYFLKGDGNGYYYHPLTLKVLGIQLGCNKYDRNKWAGVLKEVDTFNRGRDEEHPVFSILRKSFDSLLPMDRMLFMDVALFLPEAVFPDLNLSLFEWLSMVHGTSVHNIMERLEWLKRMSLLEDLGDGRSTRIGMHDLWLEFALFESKAGEFECRRWVYELGKRGAREEGYPSGGCWQNMKRMRFLGDSLMIANGMKFDHFANITVMSLVSGTNLPGDLVLDVTKLRRLKSLELVLGRHGTANVEVVGLDSAMNLRFLHLGQAEFAAAVIDSIGCLTNLQVLVMTDFGGERLPDLRKLISLEEVVFSSCFQVTATSGFSSRLSNLRVLTLYACYGLTSVGPGLGDLVALHKLTISLCVNLRELPNLQKLTNLRVLDIGGSSRIKSMPGLDDLVALEQVRVWNCNEMAELCNMSKLTILQALDLPECLVVSVPGMGDLIALRELRADFIQLRFRHDLQRLSWLRELDIKGCSSPEFMRGVANSSMLESLTVIDCTLVDEVPDCQNLKSPKVLKFDNCEFKDVSGLSGYTALERLDICGCGSLETLPDMQKLIRLKWLVLEKCDVVRDVSGISHLPQLETLKCEGLPLLREVPDLCNVPHLMVLDLAGCDALETLASSGPLVVLEHLDLSGCKSLNAFPDLSNFPQLEVLRLCGLESLKELTCTGPLAALEKLDLSGCKSLNSVPDSFSKFL